MNTETTPRRLLNHCQDAPVDIPGADELVARAFTPEEREAALRATREPDEERERWEQCS